MVEINQNLSEKIVLQFGSRTIKGYLEAPDRNTIDELMRNSPAGSPESFHIRRLDSNIVEEVPIQNLKAVFYVHTFEGNAGHKILNFHAHVPTVDGIWMRFKFIDGEVMEGMVFNSMRYLVDPGFFVVPTDPGSNNKLVYVVKNWLADHRVLGLRKIQSPG